MSDEQPAFTREDYTPGTDTRTLTPYAIPILDIDADRYYDDFPLLYGSDQQKLEKLIGEGFIFASSVAVLGWIYFMILDMDGNELQRASFSYTTTDIVGNMEKLHHWIEKLDLEQLKAMRDRTGD